MALQGTSKKVEIDGQPVEVEDLDTRELLAAILETLSDLKEILEIALSGK